MAHLVALMQLRIHRITNTKPTALGITRPWLVITNYADLTNIELDRSLWRDAATRRPNARILCETLEESTKAAFDVRSQGMRRREQRLHS